MIRGVCFALLAMYLPIAAGAGTEGEEDRILVINPLTTSDFEVVQGMNMGAAEFWCGAASYVERRLGLSETTPIYLKRPRGPSRTAAGRKAVTFSLSAAGLPPDDPARLTLTVKQPGAMVKSVNARRYCRDAFTRSTK
ncbi:hypothetical protein JQV27_01260 [Sulfitobacter mediterraneus]|jgi:hypothetical protein|uniref:hypothetical protein n=1 Tax=Sulfitobacter mediterraneus TaxID=83219 RepID=UPI00193373E2|nr:hypothetical protein [Sulfitobacter mediterraneus]MBM1631450.1 hypothetical protein [Sulfitobacter mediterraneus]MBM1639265.1 hypothetical protein [Sulfitobacter mediterraneus]MBM1643314.1 hypothetical protein [Sulfitobacter mediterraneus]MBM1647360.1 hypothetical protein [Sulfitobacter mediterraneus]MBM1651405.1 hypothetical protein [Sulfitobacter mediterraneus]